MSVIKSLPKMLGRARYKTYFDAAGKDSTRAAELYEWNSRVASAWHFHISYVEIAVRNSMDKQLCEWNSVQPKDSGSCFSPDWTVEDEAAPPIYAIVGSQLAQARKAALKEIRARPREHPRKHVTPNHDDVVAQLMFGAWCRLIFEPARRSSQDNQKLLWEECLSKAFSRAEPNEEGRRQVGRQLESIRRLRNRVAHHENLLEVKINARLNGSLKLLSFIDPDFPRLAMSSNELRTLAKEDPRKSWN